MNSKINSEVQSNQVASLTENTTVVNNSMVDAINYCKEVFTKDYDSFFSKMEEYCKDNELDIKDVMETLDSNNVFPNANISFAQYYNAYKESCCSFYEYNWLYTVDGTIDAIGEIMHSIDDSDDNNTTEFLKAVQEYCHTHDLDVEDVLVAYDSTSCSGYAKTYEEYLEYGNLERWECFHELNAYRAHQVRWHFWEEVQDLKHIICDKYGLDFDETLREFDEELYNKYVKYILDNIEKDFEVKNFGSRDYFDTSEDFLCAVEGYCEEHGLDFIETLSNWKYSAYKDYKNYQAINKAVEDCEGYLEHQLLHKAFQCVMDYLEENDLEKFRFIIIEKLENAFDFDGDIFEYYDAWERYHDDYPDTWYFLVEDGVMSEIDGIYDGSESKTEFFEDVQEYFDNDVAYIIDDTDDINVDTLIKMYCDKYLEDSDSEEVQEEYKNWKRIREAC